MSHTFCCNCLGFSFPIVVVFGTGVSACLRGVTNGNNWSDHAGKVNVIYTSVGKFGTSAVFRFP